ncbi:MAG: hypothetical protein PHF86_11640 [Candidatus Nanoarchaeia archaeon]|nr:hypothetical protein [Candidatus Nanoarchaeia archaeon]
MKFLYLFVLCIMCSSSAPWLSYSVRYVGSEKECNLLLKELEKKNQECRVICHDSGAVYEINYRPIK